MSISKNNLYFLGDLNFTFRKLTYSYIGLRFVIKGWRKEINLQGSRINRTQVDR